MTYRRLYIIVAVMVAAGLLGAGWGLRGCQPQTAVPGVPLDIDTPQAPTPSVMGPTFSGGGEKYVGAKTIPRRIGRMFGVTTPPTNGIWTTWEPWNLIETQRGVYNWQRIDDKIALADAVNCKIQLQILPYISTEGEVNGHYFINYTPTGYAQGYQLTSGTLAAVVPAYDDSGWRAGYLAMIDALADRYDGNDTIICMSVATGIDGETQPTKILGADWLAIMNQQAPGLAFRFNQWVYQAMDGFAASFTQTPLVLNNAPGGNARLERAQYAVAHGVGLKHSGLQPDIDSARGTGASIGSWDPMDAFSTTHTIPLWFESAHEGSAAFMYWSMYPALHFHADAIDVHSGFLTTVDAPFRAWVESYLGRTEANTPGTWTVLRDREFAPVSGGGGTLSGWPGNWNFYQTIIPAAGSTIVTHTIAGDWMGRNVGVLNGTANVDMATGTGRDAHTLRVIAYGETGDTLAVGWRTSGITGTGSIALSTGWATHTLELPGLSVGAGIEITLTGSDMHLHRVEVMGTGGVLPTDTPEPTDTPAPTWTPGGPTATPSATPTNTTAPTATWTPGGPTATPTLSPTPDGTRFEVMHDTQLDSWAPTTNYGTSQWLYVRQGGIKNLLYEFDISAVPAGSTITSAYLHLNVLGRSNTGTLPVTAYPVLRDWVEHQATWNIAATGTNWTTGGCNGVSTDRLSSPTGAYTLTQASGWAVLNITDVAGYWLNNRTDPAQLLIVAAGDTSVQYQIAAIEYDDPAYQPYLSLNYSAVATPSPTVTRTPTRTRTPTATRTATATPTITPTPTNTAQAVDVVISKNGTPLYSGSINAVVP